MKNKLMIFSGSALSLGVFASSAFAEGGLIDFSTLTTAIQTDVTASITAILPFLGLLLGAFLGWKVFRKLTGAK